MPTLGLISAPDASDAPPPADAPSRPPPATPLLKLLDEKKYLAYDAGEYIIDIEAEEDEIEDETVFDAVNLAARLWSKEGQQTHQFREAVCNLFSLGLSRADISYTLRQSVHAEPMRDKSSDPLYKTIHRQIIYISQQTQKKESRSSKVTSKTKNIGLVVEVPPCGGEGKPESKSIVVEESPVSVARLDVNPNGSAGKSRDINAKHERSATANEDEAVDLAAKLWSTGRQKHDFRAVVCTCFSLGLSRADIAVRIRRSVCAEPIASRTSDKLYKCIYNQIAYATRALRTSESKGVASGKTGNVGTAGGSPCDGVGRPDIESKSDASEGAAAVLPAVVSMPRRAESASIAHLARDLSELAIQENGRRTTAHATSSDEYGEKVSMAVPVGTIIDVGPEHAKAPDQCE
jgi:hypothetical protein